MLLRSLRPFGLALLLAVADATSTMAAPGTLTGVIAAPNPAAKGSDVSITLSKTGTDCGFKINYGFGPIGGPFGFTSASKVVSHAYPQAGSYTISVWGKDKGNKPACLGGTKTAPLTVTTRGGGRTPGNGPVLGLKPPGGQDVLKQAPKGMQLLDLTVQAVVIPGKDHAKFNVTANRDATLKLRLFGLVPPPNKRCDEALSPLKATFALGKKTAWNTQIVGLSPSKKHYWEVCANDAQGNTAMATGTFKTGDPLVEITFGRIHVTDDSDSAGEGELWYIFEAGGQRADYYPPDYQGTGETVFPNKKLTFSQGKEVAIRIRGGDNDGDSFISASGNIPDGNYEDWGEIKKTVPLGSVEGTTTYDWTAADHGLGFHARVTVKVTFQ